MCIHEFCHHKVLTKLFTGLVTGDAYFGDTFYAIPRSSSICVLGFEMFGTAQAGPHSEQTQPSTRMADERGSV